MEKRPFFRAATAGLGKYRTGSYGRIGVSISYHMILGEFGPIFSDTLFTQTARNRTINIDFADLTRVRGTFLKV